VSCRKKYDCGMENNHVDACRELYRGSFKKANTVACLAGVMALAVLVPVAVADYLPDDISTTRIILAAVMAYALTFATMMWIPGRALKESRMRDDAGAG
jgi:uncharacterized membrane protein YesL